MPNQSLIVRIEACLKFVQGQQVSAQTLADSIRVNGRALEAMPYALIQEMERIASALDIAHGHDEDGFLPELDLIFVRVQDWLSKLPRDA